MILSCNTVTKKDGRYPAAIKKKYLLISVLHQPRTRWRPTVRPSVLMRSNFGHHLLISFGFDVVCGFFVGAQLLSIIYTLVSPLHTCALSISTDFHRQSSSGNPEWSYGSLATCERRKIKCNEGSRRAPPNFS